jgi:hypothetical protein
MKKLILVALTLISSMILIARMNFAQTSQEPLNTNNRVPYKTIQLFNGRNLNGWYTFIKDRGRDNDPNKVFTVRDGLIHISGEEWGCITTNKEYENYRLVVEFKWGVQTFAPRVAKARDSGVLLHSKGLDGAFGGNWMYSIECQLIEGGTGDLLVVGNGSEQFALTCPVSSEKQGDSYVFQPKGDPVTIHSGRINWYGRDPNWQDVKGFHGEKDIEKPLGEWNRLECITDGAEISIFLNGTLINHAINVQPSKGRIQLQSEGAEILFRRVDLTLLPKN